MSDKEDEIIPRQRPAAPGRPILRVVPSAEPPPPPVLAPVWPSQTTRTDHTVRPDPDKDDDPGPKAA